MGSWQHSCRQETPLGVVKLHPSVYRAFSGTNHKMTMFVISMLCICHHNDSLPLPRPLFLFFIKNLFVSSKFRFVTACMCSRERLGRLRRFIHHYAASSAGREELVSIREMTMRRISAIPLPWVRRPKEKHSIVNTGETALVRLWASLTMLCFPARSGNHDKSMVRPRAALA